MSNNITRGMGKKMKQINNFGNAAVIVTCIYFLVKEGFVWWIGLILLLAMGTWQVWGTNKKAEELLDAQIQERKANRAEILARTLNMNEHTVFVRVQRLAWERRLSR